MEYDEYKQNIKSGDLLIWSKRRIRSLSDICSFLIRFFTRSEYSHVGVAWVVANRIFVIEAVAPLVRIYPLSKQLPFYCIPMNIEWTPERELFLLSNVGKPYSTLKAIISYFKPIKQDGSWQCVELSSEFYRDAGLEFGDCYTPSEFVYSVMEKTNSGLNLIR